jgi:hypothetical protein
MATKKPLALYDGETKEIQAGDAIDSSLLSSTPYNVLQQAVINGNFAINQRVVSGTVTLAAGAYGHDRWKAGATGCTYTFATSANVTTLTITAGSLIQIIEGVNLYTGTYTLSWTGTSQGKIGAGSYGANGITGSVTGGTNLSIEFGTGTLSKVNFNFGSVAIPFQAKSFTDELFSCMRYYEKSYSYGTAIQTNTLSGAALSVATSTNAIQGKQFQILKRTASSTISIYAVDGTISKVSDGALVTRGTIISAIYVSDKGLGIVVDSGSGLTKGEAYFYHYVADAEL